MKNSEMMSIRLCYKKIDKEYLRQYNDGRILIKNNILINRDNKDDNGYFTIYVNIMDYFNENILWRGTYID